MGSSYRNAMLQATCSQLCLLSLLPLLATASPTNKDKAISPDLNTVGGVALDKLVNLAIELTESIKKTQAELVPKCPHGGEYPECEEEPGETTTEDVQEKDVQEEDVKKVDVQEKDVQKKDVQKKDVQKKHAQKKDVQKKDVQKEKDVQEEDGSASN